MAQPVKHLILDIGSGHDLGIVRSSPMLGSMLGVELAKDSISPSPSSPAPLKNKKEVTYRIVCNI